MLAMQSVQSYYPCYRCMHHWQPGPRSSCTIYGGYRCFLPEGHPWRAKTFSFNGRKYEFRDAEQRPTPIKRTEALVTSAVRRAKPNRPYLGHKSQPLLSEWDVDWERSMPDRLHDYKVFAEMVLKGLVGKGSDGFYKNWKYDAGHRFDCEVFGIFTNFVNGALPPWRLTKAQLGLMDKRVNSMWWPHYSDKVSWRGVSFWKKTDRIWKAKHKILVLLTILPTCLRGYVSSAHQVKKIKPVFLNTTLHVSVCLAGAALHN